MKGKRSFPWQYLSMAYGLAWAIWIPLALTGRDYRSSVLLTFLILLGTFAPGMTAIILTNREGSRAAGREFWQRAFDYRRIRPAWVPVILLLFPALAILTITVHYLLNGSLPSFEMGRQMIAQPFGLLVIPLLYIIQAGVEELGWRGYLLDNLRANHTTFKAALIIGLFHGFWHLPLFWIAGTNQFTIGFGIDFVLFMIVGIAWSIYAAWCYYGNRRSILAVTLLHAAYNLSLGLFTDPGVVQRIYFLFAILGALVIVTIWVAVPSPHKKTMGAQVR